MTDRTGFEGPGFEGDDDRSPEQMQLYDLVFDTSLPLRPPPRPKEHYVDMNDFDRTGDSQSNETQLDLADDLLAEQFGEITEEELDEDLFAVAETALPIAELTDALSEILADLTEVAGDSQLMHPM